MNAPIGHEARIPNRRLEPLGFLVGEWSTTGSHPMLPGKTLHGRTSFEWAEDGAFLIMRSEIDEPEIPSGIGVIGTDADASECSMLYFDQRGVSRRYLVDLRSDRWHRWRDSPGFSQRFTGTPSMVAHESSGRVSCAATRELGRRPAAHLHANAVVRAMLAPTCARGACVSVSSRRSCRF